MVALAGFTSLIVPTSLKPLLTSRNGVFCQDLVDCSVHHFLVLSALAMGLGILLLGLLGLSLLLLRLEFLHLVGVHFVLGGVNIL